MAITFSKSISITEFLNAYNNNVVEFTSDAIPGGESISKATIDIAGLFAPEITPISNVFEFNFRKSSSVLINDNNHADPILPTSDIEVDNSLKENWLVTYTITFSDDTTEQTTRTYNFLKSVEQIANVSNRLITEQQILTPLNLTFFKGFPFDVGHYSDGDITLTNTSTGLIVVLTSTATNVDRIFFSRGNATIGEASIFKTRVEADGGTYEENSCYALLAGSILNVGFNTITIVDRITKTLIIKLVDLCAGTYLKWLNEDGAWGYWLFNPIHKENIRTKTLDEVNVDFESIGDTYTTSVITGKEAKRQRVLISDSLTQNEMLQLESLLSSPRVELYNGVQDDAVTVDSWQTVKVLDGGFRVANTKRPITDLKITIDINKYTQT